MNPFLPPSWHIPDGEAHVFGGGLFLYGSCDQSKEQFCSGEYYVAHTRDLCHWQIGGPSFRAADAPWRGKSQAHSSVSGVKSFDELPQHIRDFLPDSARQIPIEEIVRAIEESARKDLPKETLLYAPDAAQKNGKTFLYLCMSDDSEGVAVSDSPAGPFTGAVQLKTDKSGKPITGIDPAVFVDRDGQAYYYWGQFRASCARLTPDMTALEEDSIVEGILTEGTHHFHEGSSMRRRGDTYYYVFADSSRGKPTCLGYATGKSPMGPFTYQGVIIDNAGCDPGAWNNHGSIEEFNGHWYVFYHRSSGNSQYGRRACMEPIQFNAQGLIAEVKPTSQGAGAPFGPGEAIPGYTACEVEGGAYVAEDTLVVPQGGGSALFRYVRCEAPARTLNLSGSGTALVEAFANGNSVGRGRIEDGTIPIELPPGTYELKLVFRETRDVELSALTLE